MQSCGAKPTMRSLGGQLEDMGTWGVNAASQVGKRESRLVVDGNHQQQEWGFVAQTYSPTPKPQTLRMFLGNMTDCIVALEEITELHA